MKEKRLPKDSGKEISDAEWKRAIDCLIKELPKETFKKIWDIYLKECEIYLSDQHHGLGTQVRNILRKADFAWGAISYDQNWELVLIDATKAFFKDNDRN